MIALTKLSFTHLSKVTFNQIWIYSVFPGTNTLPVIVEMLALTTRLLFSIILLTARGFLS